MNSKARGFSLVEISVVLVVIGLIIGGVIAGASMVRNSQLQGVISDVKRYDTAIGNFKTRYKELPGDFFTATTEWGTAAACPAAGTGTQTCNGNGNGYVEPGQETFRFWQHLVNAGLIEGNYTGADGGTANQGVTGINIPRIGEKGGLTPLSVYCCAAQLGIINHPNGLVLVMGADSTNLVTSPAADWPVLTTEEALSIDTKMDDGKPLSGTVFAYPPTQAVTPNCTDTAVVATAKYKITATNNGPQCNLVFRTVY